MSERTKIEWADSTASPWTGCTPVSAGCDNCYARTLAFRYGWCKDWGAGVPRHRFVGFERSVLAMERKAAKGKFHVCPRCGHREWLDRDKFRYESLCICGALAGVGRPRVFPSLCDWLDPEVPVEWLADLLDVIQRTPHLDWLLLSKRPGLWRDRIMDARQATTRFPSGRQIQTGWMLDKWLSSARKIPSGPQAVPVNVWIGTTVENQAAAERIPDLLRIPAARRFISVEPCLGPIAFRWQPWFEAAGETYRKRLERLGRIGEYESLQMLDWVICGGESGPGARPMHPDWARALRDQCQEAGVPFLFKQWGEWGRCGESGLTLDDVPWGSDRMGFWRDGFIFGATTGDEEHMVRVGKERAGRLLDGRAWNDMPVSAGSYT